MVSDLCDISHKWFVLNYVCSSLCRDSVQKTVSRFNESENANLQLFAPTYVVREEADGKSCMKTVRLAFHYVFVKGRFEDVKKMCASSNGFSFLLNRSSEDRYAVISEAEMNNFKNIARAYENCLPYLPLDEIDLEEGDLVEVVNGDFPGLIGTFIPKPKSKTGNIVLMVFNNVGTVAYNIKVSDVRVLEFSKNSTRANDQIDAFVPQLLKALRCYRGEEPLPQSLAAKLTVFCRRMEVVRLNNRKLEAKLQALLYCGNYILGNIESAMQAKVKFEKVKDAVTNEWTAALISLLISAIEHDAQKLRTAFSRIVNLTPTSRFQQLVAEEYAYHI